MRILLTGGLKADSKIAEQIRSQVNPSCQIDSALQGDEKQNQSESTTYDYYLYIIAPGMKGIMPVVRLVDDSNKKPVKTIFCFVDREKDDEFSKHQLKSLKAIAEIVKRNGGTWIESIEGVIAFLNAKF